MVMVAHQSFSQLARICRLKEIDLRKSNVSNAF